MTAQHAAEGGVLGKVGKRFEFPGDDRGSHTDSPALGGHIDMAAYGRHNAHIVAYTKSNLEIRAKPPVGEGTACSQS